MLHDTTLTPRIAHVTAPPCPTQSSCWRSACLMLLVQGCLWCSTYQRAPPRLGVRWCWSAPMWGRTAGISARGTSRCSAHHTASLQPREAKQQPQHRPALPMGAARLLQAPEELQAPLPPAPLTGLQMGCWHTVAAAAWSCNLQIHQSGMQRGPSKGAHGYCCCFNWT